MMASQEEETKDLTTCSICLETFNRGSLKPKFLPCAHNAQENYDANGANQSLATELIK